MRKGIPTLAGVAVALVLATGIKPAWSYFTASTAASGGMTISVEPTTTVEEKYDNKTKHVTIANTGEVSVWVRARFYASDQLAVSVSGDGWTQNGDWWVYDSQLEPDTTTSALDGSITFPKPEDSEDGENYGVVAYYQSTPVQYDENGEALEPDWTLALVEDN